MWLTSAVKFRIARQRDAAYLHDEQWMPGKEVHYYSVAAGNPGLYEWKLASLKGGL